MGGAKSYLFQNIPNTQAVIPYYGHGTKVFILCGYKHVGNERVKESDLNDEDVRFLKECRQLALDELTKEGRVVET